MTWLVLGYLRERDVDIPSFLKRLGLSLGTLMNADARVPLDDLHRLWRAGQERLGDDALGVLVTSRIDPQSTFSWPPPYSVHEHIGRASATLRDSILRQARVVRLMRDGLSVHFEGAHDAPLLRFDFAVASEPVSLIDFQMASSLLLARRVSDDRTLAPREVHLSRSTPKDPDLYTRFFGAPVHFGADSNFMICDGPGLDRPIPTANPMMLEIFERRARKTIDALPVIDDFVEIVRERVEAELPSGNTNASWVAETLGISPRTLHRRLQAEGTSYQDELDRVRGKLAMRYLASRKHTINEVASLVGFAQASAFHRAFKSWTGETPAEYQERLSSGQLRSVPPPRRVPSDASS
jgi:AraC-like DNA-binding protein